MRVTGRRASQIENLGERRGKPGACPSPLAPRPCGGYSLIECLVYIAVLAVIMELAFEAYYRIELHNRRLTRNAADITRTLQAGERWREDVRLATGKLFLSGTGAEQELRIPQAKGEVAYASRQGSVWRRANPESPWVEFLPEIKRSRMEADLRTQVTAWRWELELLSTQSVARVSPLFTFQAVAPKQPKP